MIRLGLVYVSSLVHEKKAVYSATNFMITSWKSFK